MQRALVLALFAGTGWSCNKDSATSIRPEDICFELPPAACATSRACCADPGFNDSACNTFVTEICGSSVLAITQDKATYDSDKAYQCVQDVKALAGSCPTAGSPAPWLEALPNCQATFTGLLQEGEACARYPLACAPTLTCDLLGDRCVRPRNVNESCANNLPCTPGAWCNASQQCEGRLTVDSPCPAGTACAESAYCDSSNVCRAKLAAAVDCADDDECLSGLCAGVCTDPANPWCGLFLDTTCNASCAGCCYSGVCVSGTQTAACGSGATTCVDCTTQVLNATGVSCAAGLCDYTTCNSSFDDCNADRRDGCEGAAPCN